jgi:threonyl-tRNA synthetase
LGRQKQLAAYIKRIEEAEKRDHRKIGKALDLFHMQEEAPGMVFWHPNGWTIYQVLEQYMRKVQQDNGYLEIRTRKWLISRFGKNQAMLQTMQMACSRRIQKAVTMPLNR